MLALALHCLLGTASSCVLGQQHCHPAQALAVRLDLGATSKVPCCSGAQRATLLKQGLGDRAASVREAAGSMLQSWLAGEACGQDPFSLLAGLQVTEFEGEHPPPSSSSSQVWHCLRAGPSRLLTGLQGTRSASGHASSFQSELCIILVSQHVVQSALPAVRAELCICCCCR